MLVGCSQEPPNCGDAKTVTLVKQIFREQLLPEKWRAVSTATFDKGVRLDLPVPNKYEKEIKKFSCESRMSVDATAGLDKETLSAFTMLGLVDDTGKLKAISGSNGERRYNFTVNYTSQEVDGQHIVGISGVAQGQAALTGALLMQLQNPSPQPAQSPPKIDAPAPVAAQPAPVEVAAPKPVQGEETSLPLATPNAAAQPHRACEDSDGKYACPLDDLSVAKQRLNQAYKEATGRLDIAQQSELESLQRAWVKQRDAKCDNDAETALDAIICKTEATQKRVQDVMEFGSGSKRPAPLQTAQVQRPGWCSKAGTDVERMICADDSLSVLDAKMYVAYKTAEARAVDKKAFYAASRDWRVNRRDSCKSAACIADAYNARLGELGG
jgi:uncharacterized protein